MSANSNQPLQQQNRKFCVVPGAPMANASQRQQVTVTRTFTAMSAPAALASAVAQCVPAKPSTSNAAADVSRSSSKCTHASHTAVNTVASMQQISTEHYQQQLQKYREEAALCGGDTAKMNGQINEIFVKRLQDIDAHAEGDNDLKLITYQEWVDLLLKINETLITNMEDLESEVAERLEVVQRKVNTSCRNSQGNELARCRKDICSLLKIIQNAYHNHNWNMLQCVQFETLTLDQVLGLNESQQQCVQRTEGGAEQSNVNAEGIQQQNKLIDNMKALAFEVAQKHDDILELKKQVLCMEDEIQKAQKKIQLKDDVIKELRNDLKNASAKKLTFNNTTNANTLATCTEMPPINFELSQVTSRSATTQVSDGLNLHLDNTQMPYLNDDVSQSASLSQSEQVVHEKCLELDEELNGFFEVAKDLKKQNFEYYRKRFSDIFQKSEAEKAEAFRKLQYLREQLIELEVNGAELNIRITNDGDSGFSSKSENDQDAKIIDAVRKRLLKLSELKKRIHDLEVENNAISAKLEAKTSFAQRDSVTLKEVADLLSDLTGKPICYSDIYNAKCEQKNPFCTVILQFKQRQEEQFKQLEEDLCCHIKRRDIKIDEMQEYLLKREKELEQLRNSKKAHDSSKRGSNSTNTSSHCSTTNFSHTMTTQQDNEKIQKQQLQTTLQRQQHSKPTVIATPAHAQTKSQQVRQQQPVDKHIDKDTDADDNDDNTAAWNW